MKKSIALLLAVLMLLSVTACGKGNDSGDTATTTTTTTTTTASDVVGDSTTTIGGETTATDTTTTTTTTTATTTNTYVPGGVTVPIGTKPTTTTTTKKPTTTTTTAPAGEPADPTTTVTKPSTTTTTTTTVKPTEPTAPAGPFIILPEIGSDIDVTKKKNRIRVSDVAAWYEANGTIGVQLTFKNYTSNWITEETDYVEYTCYDKSGKVLKRGKIMLGVIDTKKNPVKSFEFTVPANTYEVKITKSKIVYWTEWA